MDTTAREVTDLIDEIVREASSKADAVEELTKIKESLDRTLEALAVRRSYSQKIGLFLMFCAIGRRMKWTISA